MEKNARQVARAGAFIASIPKGSSVFLVSHTDQDGLCSLVQLAKAGKALGWKECGRLFLAEHGFEERELKKVKAAKPDFVFVTDLNFTRNPKFFNKLGEEMPFRVLNLDHHIYEKTYCKEIIFCDALDFSENPSQYPASKVVFDCLKASGLLELKGIFGELEWLCAIGVIGDFSEKQWKKFVARARKEFPGIDAVSHVIELARLNEEEQAVNSSKALFSSKTPKELLSGRNPFSKKMLAAAKRAEDAFETSLQKALARIDEVLLQVVEVKKPRGISGGSLASLVSNHLSKEFPEKIIACYSRSRKGVFKFSLRNQSRVKSMAFLASESTKGIGAGGGHAPAAGGWFREEKKREWLERIKELVAQN
jgi:single-stranded DNA-specific DHH superfamily exonuclease